MVPGDLGPSLTVLVFNLTCEIYPSHNTNERFTGGMTLAGTLVVGRPQ